MPKMKPLDVDRFNGKEYRSKSGNLAKMEVFAKGGIAVHWDAEPTEEDKQEFEDWIESQASEGVRVKPERAESVEAAKKILLRNDAASEDIRGDILKEIVHRILLQMKSVTNQEDLSSEYSQGVLSGIGQSLSVIRWTVTGVNPGDQKNMDGGTPERFVIGTFNWAIEFTRKGPKDAGFSVKARAKAKDHIN